VRSVHRAALGLGAVLIAGMAASAYLVQPLFGVSRNPSLVRAEPARLRTHVESLVRRCGPRDSAHPENLDRAAEYIRDEWLASDLEVSFQAFDAGARSYRNVIASSGPRGGETIVVGAHYDAASPGVGADDNASGVAGILELARLLSLERASDRVELVAYALEEPPFFRTRSMGSYAHARALRENGVSVRAMICLEMIGFYADAPASQRYPFAPLRFLYPSTGDFVAVVGCLGQSGIVRTLKRAMLEKSNLPVYSINAPRWVPGIDFSDHLNYWDAGFDAVLITDTAFYRNPNYHRATDTADTLDYLRMASAVEGVHAAVRRLGE
jgi:hypothetical protein